MDRGISFPDNPPPYEDTKGHQSQAKQVDTEAPAQESLRIRVTKILQSCFNIFRTPAQPLHQSDSKRPLSDQDEDSYMVDLKFGDGSREAGNLRDVGNTTTTYTKDIGAVPRPKPVRIKMDFGNDNQKAGNLESVGNATTTIHGTPKTTGRAPDPGARRVGARK
ncbi:hypothetical protein C7212DRAFT_348306 [Tuber magnatum]|uniref:Uncharacterized protein n=1 Tax=Tuber magnatum TaxID=42249 RepID=A0A317SC85_9PEZI|nr:hypothetical protein C7212DRAFT_348306 [Tuber magnatum]